jgi:hypothetical protein
MRGQSGPKWMEYVAVKQLMLKLSNSSLLLEQILPAADWAGDGA